MLAAYLLWLVFRNPNHKVLITSKSESHAKDTLKLIVGWIQDIWFLQHLRSTGEQRDSATKYDVGPSKKSRTPTFAAKGITGMVTGSRANTVAGDDVETDDNTKSLDAREALDKKCKELSAMAFGEGDEVVYIGTYQHEESVYFKLAERHYQFRTYPLIYPGPGDQLLNMAPLLQSRLDDGIVDPGDPVFPNRFGRDYVIDKQSEGRTHFDMQYALLANLASTNRHPLRLSDLIVFPVDRNRAPVYVIWGTQDHNGPTNIEDIPCLGFEGDRLYRPVKTDDTWATYTGTKAYIDPSGRGADETGFTSIGHLSGFLWCKRCIGLKGGFSPEALDELARHCRETNSTDIYIEDNFGRGMFQELFEPVLRRHFLDPGKDPAFPAGWRASLTSVNATGQKEVRIIDTLEPVMSTHRLIMHPDSLRPSSERESAYELQRQIAAITRQPHSLKHDDRLDSLAGCVKQWQHVLDKDTKRASVVAKERWIDAEADRVLRDRGVNRPKPRFFQHR